MVQSSLSDVVVNALDEIADIVEVTDLEGRYLYVNETFERKTGWSLDEALGKTPAELLRSDVHTSEYFDNIWSTIASGETWTGRLTSRIRDGSHLVQEAFISPVFDDDEITHFVAVKRDITEQVELNNQEREAERLESIAELATGLGHEINNPLGYMMANLRHLRSQLEEMGDEVDHDELVALVDDSMEGARHIRDIVRDLAEMGQSVDDVQSVDVVDAMSAAIDILDAEWTENVEIVRDFGDVDEVRAERRRLIEVFVNLLLNGLQAVVDGDCDGERLSIVISQDEQSVIVAIRDSGCGIDDAHIERVFDPFFSTKHGQQTTGLGLSMCYWIIDDFDGSIDIESEVREGTTLTVRLPRRAVDVGVDASQ